MRKTWKPTVAGILLIVHGIAIPVESIIMYSVNDETALLALPLLFVPLWLFPIFGGIAALKRTRWGRAITGAIVALFYCPLGFWGILIGMPSFWGILWLGVLPFLGIPALVLVALSKKEFR